MVDRTGIREKYPELLYKYTENRKKEKFESYLDCYY
jgi:hypothetical protein